MKNKMKKIWLVLFLLLVINCGSKVKNEKQQQIPENVKKEIESINDSMSENEKDNMLSVAKLNYSMNPELGKMYLEKIVKYRPEAAEYLADYYHEKKDDINYEKWQKIFVESEKGTASSMFNLGLHFAEKKNYEMGEKYYLMAIEKGHKEAKTNLAIMYGKWEKYDKATALFKELGMTDGDGMYYTAMYYRTQKDYKKAEEIYHKMIELGNPDGYFGLGETYRILKKKRKSEEYYQKGADMGEPKSAFKIGYIKHDHQHYREAEKYYLIAANKGHVTAMFNLAVIYTSFGNYENAKKWAKKAGEKGDSEGYVYLKEIEEREKKEKEILERINSK